MTWLTFAMIFYQVNNIFNEENPESALEFIIDGNLKGNYPPEDVYKVDVITILFSFMQIIMYSILKIIVIKALNF